MSMLPSDKDNGPSQKINEWEEAIALDTYLVRDYPEVRKLADHLYQEIVEHNMEKLKTGQERYKTKESLKIILINLFIGYQAGLPIRYSRRKSAYSGNSRFKQLFFKHNRVISIIDTFSSIGYIEHKIGFNDREKGIGRQSRIKVTPKLVDLFREFSFIAMDVQAEPLSSDELVQLREPDKKLTDDDYKRFEPMRERLLKYNDFISSSKIEVRLDRNINVSRHTLKNISLDTIKGKCEISKFNITDHKFILKNRDEEIEGYNIGSSKYIIINKQLSVTMKSYIRTSSDIKYTDINKVYVDYIRYYITNEKRDNIESRNRENKNLTMTGTYFEICEYNQSVDTFETTTMEEFEDISEKRPLSDYGIEKLDFMSKYQYLHRVFNVFPDLGGRFYGANHITMPKKVRRCIFINGSPTTELDFGAHHIRMLYHYYLNMPYTEDPYKELCKDNPDERAIYKRVLLVAINAKDEKTAVKGIRKKLWQDGIRYDLTDESIMVCLDKVKKHHPSIARFIHSGIGLQLQYYEGCIVAMVLSSMLKEGIPCLPIHDSFIIPAEYEDLLRKAMVEAYQKVIGDFVPVIEKVK